jgi:hypothetical protein
VQQSPTDGTAGNFSIWRLSRIQSFVKSHAELSTEHTFGMFQNVY